MKRLLALAALGAWLGGCTGGTETGNPSFDAKLTYTAYSSRPDIVVRESGTGVVVDTVWLVLGDVRFERQGACDPEASGNPRAPALGVGNHANDAPASTTFEMNTDEYCGVGVAFERTGAALPAEAPASLAVNTAVIEGVAPGGTPFVLESDVQEIFQLSPPDAGAHFDMSAEMPNTLMKFDVGIWLETIDWSGATESGGKIVISATENTSLHQAFQASLREGISVFRDDAGGELLATGARD